MGTAAAGSDKTVDQVFNLQGYDGLQGAAAKAQVFQGPQAKPTLDGPIVATGKNNALE